MMATAIVPLRPSGAAVGIDGDAEAEIESGAGGRTDAHVRHQPGEDDVLAPGRGEPRLQVGAGERVG
jgi:hypothetical protein